MRLHYAAFVRSLAFAMLSMFGCGAPVGVAGDTATEAPPTPPDNLVRYLTGNPGDVSVATSASRMLLMGGGADVDAAFSQWLSEGGDVVVLRASGADGYNEYLYTDIGGIDSVETLIVDTRALADDDYVAWTLAHAETIFIAGGDQADYFAYWQNTAVAAAIEAAWQRRAAIGGTSAGLAVLGAYAFSAANGTVYSDEALADPYNEYMTLDTWVALPSLANTITDSHFRERDRMGRLVAFVARLVSSGKAPVYGLGLDEATAIVLDGAGVGRVYGSGGVYVVASAGLPQQCVAGDALEYLDVPYAAFADGAVLAFPLSADAGTRTVSAAGGGLVPADPYL